MSPAPRPNSRQHRFPVATLAGAFALIATVFLLQGCTTITRPNTVAQLPVISPPSGFYTAPITVTITDTNPAAAIHYTLDGTMPTANSPLYFAPISISAVTTVQAVATINGIIASGIATANYSILQTATPVFTPPAGDYPAPQTVTLSDATSGSTIYYTIDGTIPSTASTVYTGPLTVSRSQTINAIATAPGYLTSNVATAVYNIGSAVGLWIWMGGGPGSTINYGTLGIPSSANLPAGRVFPVSWVDKAGNFWLFGGDLTDTGAAQMNDLWEYTPATNQWTWQSGSQTPNQPSVHGLAGVADPANVPAARDGAFSWTDTSGNLWLFGGIYDLPNGQGYYLNDLWKFDTTAKLWTWYSGNPIQFPIGVYGTKGAASATNIPGGRVDGAAWSDSSGNLWLFGGTGVGYVLSSGHLNDLWKYSTSTNQWTWVAGSNVVGMNPVYGTQGVPSTSNTAGALALETADIDSNNRVWFFGGNGNTSQGPQNDLNTFWQLDLSTGQWTWVDGAQTAPQLGNFGDEGTPSPLNIPTGRSGAYGWADVTNAVWVFGGFVYDGGTGGLGNDLWRFDTTTRQWTWMTGSSHVYAQTVYGQLGVASPGSTPGARQAGVTWTDAAGNLWLFSGENQPPEGGVRQIVNELWRYQP